MKVKLKLIEEEITGSVVTNNTSGISPPTTASTLQTSSTTTSTSNAGTDVEPMKVDVISLKQDKSYEREGRLGPRVVAMNKKSSTGVLQLRENDLEVESHSNFSSIRANVCVYKGKWMYEATLGTAGIQQIGWAPLECPFTNEVYSLLSI